MGSFDATRYQPLREIHDLDCELLECDAIPVKSSVSSNFSYHVISYKLPNENGGGVGIIIGSGGSRRDGTRKMGGESFFRII